MNPCPYWLWTSWLWTGCVSFRNAKCKYRVQPIQHSPGFLPVPSFACIRATVVKCFECFPIRSCSLNWCRIFRFAPCLMEIDLTSLRVSSASWVLFIAVRLPLLVLALPRCPASNVILVIFIRSGSCFCSPFVCARMRCFALPCFKGEVKARIKISPVVVFGVLSRMVLVRES